MRKLIAVCCALLLSACGGGGGGESGPPQSPGGVYTGTFHSNAANVTFPVKGVVSEAGRFFFVDLDNGPIYQGAGNTKGDKYDGFFKAFAPDGFEFINGDAVTEGPILGTIDERGTLIGTYRAQGGDTGTFNLTYVPAEYEIASSLGLLVGTWNSTNDGVTSTITIAASGKFTGTDSDGCTYSGTVSLVDPDFNAYHVTTNQVCGGTTNGMGGVLTYTPAVGAGKPTFAVGLGGVKVGIFAIFTKS